MSYKVKGSAGPFIGPIRLVYNPEDGTYIQETTFVGSARAIEGQSAEFRNKNKGHTSLLELNGTGETTLQTPIAIKSTPEDQAPIRYEIATEFIEQDIFRHKTISDAADIYDAARAEGEDSFRKFCEKAVDEIAASADPTQERVTTHLRKGLTGFEREYIVLRRSRKLPFTGAGIVPQASILDGRFIYSTGQLGLPAAVAFGLPDLASLPTSDWDDVIWGWRRRPSSVVFEGNFIEQSSEFILAEWSLLLYELAQTSATW
jgi:hypothetical protein